MRWGLYCDDARLASWLDRASHSPAQPSLLAVPTPAATEFLQTLPRVETCPDWSTLLVTPGLETLLLAGTSDEAATAIRQLCQADLPVYLRPHPDHGISLAYELTLNAADRATPLRPLWPYRSDPVLSALHRWLTDNSVRVTHLELQRSQAIADDIAAAETDQKLHCQQLDDLDLLRWLGLQASRVTALSSARPVPGHRRLSITLEAESGPAGLWMFESDRQLPTVARLTLQTDRGCVSLQQQGHESWQLSLASAAHFPTADIAAPLLDNSVAWEDAVAVLEWQAAIERSLTRRRAIEIHAETLSERTQFKTQMAVAGCAVLIGTLLLCLLYLTVAALLPLPAGLLHGLRIAIFAPLFLFLLSQLLLPLTRSASHSRRPTDSASEEERRPPQDTCDSHAGEIVSS